MICVDGFLDRLATVLLILFGVGISIFIIVGAVGIILLVTSEMFYCEIPKWCIWICILPFCIGAVCGLIGGGIKSYLAGGM